MSLFAELKRRNVFRVGVAYVVSAWLLLQLTEVLVELLGLPETAGKLVVLLLVIGFIPALIFAWAFELTPEGLKREKEVDRTQSIAKQTGRKLDYAIIAMLALAVVYLLVDKFRGPAEQGSGPFSETTALATDAPGDGTRALNPTDTKSIAVLPFNNMSGDAENEYFSDGISEEILNALAKVTELKVAGRTSSFAFKGRNEDLRLIGETLGVNHILEGSVRKAGNRVRVTAQLIQVSDGFHLWSDTYDRELTDIFAIQDEIAGAILAALKARLIGEEQLASTRTDTAAYEKYLLAKQRIYTRNVPEMENAQRLLDEVIALDPGFAPAWAQRGIATLLLAETEYGSIPFAQAQSEARRFLDRAVELDPDLAEGWAALGLYYDNQPGRTDEPLAIQYLEKALELNPSLINASNWLQNVYRSNNRVTDALALLEDMFERDPLYPPALNNLLMLYGQMGQIERADKVLETMRLFYTNHEVLANGESMARNWSGRYGESLQFARQAIAMSPQDQTNLRNLSIVYMELGELDKVLEIDYLNPWVRILALNRMGRNEEATLLAERWMAQSGRRWPYVRQLADSGQHEKLVEFAEATWPDLEAMNTELGGNFGFGNEPMLDMAWAYREVGLSDKFRQAMALVREENDAQIAQGASSQFIWLAEAEYWTLADDYQRALDYLDRAVSMGLFLDRIEAWQPVLAELRLESRFAELSARSLSLLNRERAKAGLQPLEAGTVL